jgi:DNA-binding beta-propeller fold protein YncE
MSGSSFPAGQIPFGIEIDKLGKVMFVPNSVSNSVTVFSIDSSGRLQTLQTMSTPGNAFSVALM